MHQRSTVIPWCLVTLLLCVLAVRELDRVAEGRLFLFGFGFESGPSVPELHDARDSAIQWRLPSIAGVVFASVLIASLTRTKADRRMLSRPLVFLLLVSAALDLASTVWFFHMDGIDFELHPAVRLFGYAYGRTAGPLMAKSVQAGGVLFIASKLPRFSKPLLIGTSCVYALAGLCNVII